MKLVRSYLDRVHGKLQNEYDRFTVVLGDEGVGKSTFIMQTAWFWQDVIGRDPTIGATIDTIAWDYDDFKRAMANREAYSAIAVHDATRVLNKKKAMHGDQIELEEDLFDVRQGRFFFMLGFQDWRSVPTVLTDRRAHNVFHVTSRGRVRCYNREQINKRNESGSWPDPAFVDSFADLDGTELWSAFKDEDLRRKQSRIEPAGEDDEEDWDVEDVVSDLKSNGIKDVIGFHEAHRRHQFDADLIGHKYNLSQHDARLAKKLLAKDLDPEEIVEENEVRAHGA